jgi:hypothetical protein
MTIDHSIEEPCEVTSLTHGFEAERRGRPLRLGSNRAPMFRKQQLVTSCAFAPNTVIEPRLPGIEEAACLMSGCVA